MQKYFRNKFSYFDINIYFFLMMRQVGDYFNVLQMLYLYFTQKFWNIPQQNFGGWVNWA